MLVAVKENIYDLIPQIEFFILDLFLISSTRFSLQLKCLSIVFFISFPYFDTFSGHLICPREENIILGLSYWKCDTDTQFATLFFGYTQK